MIIHSVRLKNIRSYGGGPDGNGITLYLAPGINHITGRNGFGKSTIIESLGYGLFVTEPLNDEKFETGVYFVRAGESTGEIDVTFEQAGQLYRIEKGVGKASRRRTKVVLVSDDSIEAEGEKEVQNYLCRLLNLPSTDRLSELFSKLIGVKQGRLGWPFDSTPRDARDHFEPLLSVEIFRACFDKLKPVADGLRALRHDQEKILAAISERIASRKDSPERLKEREEEAIRWRRQASEAKTKESVAEQRKTAEETKEKAFLAAKQDYEGAVHQLQLALGKRQNDEVRLAESQAAMKVMENCQTGHAAFVEAERELASLQEKQTKKTALEKELADLKVSRSGWMASADAAREQAKVHLQQAEHKSKAGEELKKQTDAEEKELIDGEREYERLQTEAKAAAETEAALGHWVELSTQSVARLTKKGEQVCATWDEIANWDPRLLALAVSEEAESKKNWSELSQRLAATEESVKLLGTQAEEIRGGLCPFLKERCKQFDPAKVQSDISQKQTLVADLRKQTHASSMAHKGATDRLAKLKGKEAELNQLRRNLEGQAIEFASEANAIMARDMSRWLKTLADFLTELAPSISPPPLLSLESEDPCADLKRIVVASLKSHTAYLSQIRDLLRSWRPRLHENQRVREKQREHRTRHQADVLQAHKRVEQLFAEGKEQTSHSRRKNEEATSAERSIAKANSRITELEKLLEPYAGLDALIQTQQRIKESNTQQHQQFLGARTIAGQHDERLAALKVTLGIVGQAEEAKKLKQARFEQCEFQPVVLAQAREAATQARASRSEAEVKLAHAEKELAAEESRHKELQTAMEDKQKIDAEIGSLQAAIGLTELGRKTLPKAAPLVAEHLCARIASRAQVIYNQLNPEPVELAWPSERYSLRINPGDRRFAMLSGGEQTKLALAMNLAMIQEFCGLRFCVFDEPTYGVDAESREKLANAIVNLYETARFEQLLLVSHDEAFEGKIEHVVRLHKTVAEGSCPVE